MFEQDKGFEAYMRSLESSEVKEELDNEISEDEATDEVVESGDEVELDNTPEEDEVEVEDDEPVVEEEESDDADTEIEESEEAEEESVEDSEEEDLYSIDGVEITKSRLEELIEFEKSYKDSEIGLNDYTKLNESLEAERKEIAAEREFAQKIISEKLMTEEQLQEFGEEYGFEEYQRVLKEQKQLNDEFNKLKESSVATNKVSQEEQLAAIQGIYETFPTWFNVTEDKAEYTEEFNKAKEEMTKHMKEELKASDADIAKFNTAPMLKLIQDSIELKKLKATKDEVVKKVKKATIVPKGAPKVTTSAKQRIQKLQKAYDSNPTRENYLKLEAAKQK